MMEASAAKKIAVDSLGANSAKVLNQLSTLIKKAADEGRTSLCDELGGISDEVRNEVIRELENLGYRVVRYVPGQHEALGGEVTHYTIDWC